MSGDWMEQYSAALDIRDAREQAHKPYIDAYTRLADKTAAAASATTTNTAAAAPSTAQQPTTSRSSTPVKGPKPPDQPTPPPDLLLSLRTDLAATQKARSALQSKLDDLTTTLTHLRTTSKQSTAQIAALSRQKADTERKLRDREDEIRQKGRLATDAQDEMVALQLQLNMAEQRSEKLEKENQELVERWMKRMGEEAEKMNRTSRWE